METPDLIYAARHGNLQAFNRLVLEHQDAIYSLVRYILPGEQDAAAVTQTALRRLYRKLPGYRGGDFRIWLFKVVVEACRPFLNRDRFRIRPGRNGKQSTPILSTVSSQLGGNDPQPAVTQAIQRCLADLSPELRLVVVLVDLESLDYAQAALVLGISVRSVRSRLAKARQRILDHPSYPAAVVPA